jgi:hypothetical protein
MERRRLRRLLSNPYRGRSELGNEQRMPLLVLINNGLTHIEMHTHILMTVHGMSPLHRGKKTPFVQRFQQ